MQVVLKAAGQRGLVPRGATERFSGFLSTDSDGDEAVLAFMILYTIWCFIVFFLTFYVQRFLQHTVHSGEWVCHGVWMCLIWNDLVTVTFERGNSTQFFDCAWLETVKIVHIRKHVHCCGRPSLASFGFKILRILCLSMESQVRKGWEHVASKAVLKHNNFEIRVSNLCCICCCCDWFCGHP